jgi:hypothetical protein
MKQYQHRVSSIEAQQFKGGIADASHILNWIHSNGGKGVWCGATVPYTNSDGRIKHPGLPETLRIRTPHGWEMVGVGDYVVRNEQGGFSKFDSATFDSTYENALAEVVDISPKMLEWNDHQIRPHA